MLTDLFHFRTKAGLTQRQLAELAGVSKTAIQKIESGEAIPKISTVSRIAHALNIPIGIIAEKIDEREDYIIMKKGRK